MIYSVKTFDLTLTVYKDKYKELISNAKRNAKISGHELHKYDYSIIDEALIDDGILIEYFNTMKRKVVLTIDPGLLLGSGNMIDLWKPSEKKIAKLLKKLDDKISLYFNYEYELNHFTLDSIVIVFNANLDSQEKVSSYLHLFNKIGDVKGYTHKSVKDNRHKGDIISYSLTGKSNGKKFIAYNMKAYLNENHKSASKETVKSATGVLCLEVGLKTQRAINKFTQHENTVDRINELASMCVDIFARTVLKIIPYGKFYKKPKAIKMIEINVKSNTMRRKMIKLVDLIPKQKSLLRAQKNLNDRNIEDILLEFVEQDISPVTISKRQEIDYLDNFYVYLIPDQLQE